MRHAHVMNASLLVGQLGPRLRLPRALLVLERVGRLPAGLLQGERHCDRFAIDLALDMGAGLYARVSEEGRRSVHLVVPVGAWVVQGSLWVEHDDWACGWVHACVDTRSECVLSRDSHHHVLVARLLWLQVLDALRWCQLLDALRRS